MVDQLDVIHSLAMGQREPSDAVLMDVAGALLYVEATLADMVGPVEDGAREESHLPTTDVAQIHQLVIKEARTGLEQAKDAIIEFIACRGIRASGPRAGVVDPGARGGLAMIPLTRAAALLNACNRYIKSSCWYARPCPTGRTLTPWPMRLPASSITSNASRKIMRPQATLILDLGQPRQPWLSAAGKALNPRLGQAGRRSPAPLADPLHDIEVLADEPLTDAPVDLDVEPELLPLSNCRR